jgi:ribonuclease HI
MRQALIVDASFNFETNVTGLGIAIHETDRIAKGRNGILINELSEAYLGIQDGHGEMLALFRALEISLSRGYKVVRLRSDYNAMRKSLKKSYEDNVGFDRIGLYGELMKLTQHFESVQFGYKPRRKNQMAHGLSRIGSKEMEPVSDLRLIDICSQSSPKFASR